jgi:hypothetical protein
MATYYSCIITVIFFLSPHIWIHGGHDGEKMDIWKQQTEESWQEYM